MQFPAAQVSRREFMDSLPPQERREPDPVAVAEYLAVEMSRLARMADANGFGLLAYLIDMAVLEAWREAMESEPSGRAKTVQLW
jgi:hypothetical protein